jgi:hypothetical protein
MTEHLPPEDQGYSHVPKNSVIPTEASRSEAQRRDLFWCFGDKRRSLDYAALWAVSLGMTEIITCDSPAPKTVRRMKCA